MLFRGTIFYFLVLDGSVLGFSSPSIHSALVLTNEYDNDISKRTYELQLLHEKSSKAAEAKAAETMREVIMESSQTTENVGKGDDKASNFHRQSNGSASSYAFQS